MCHYEGVIRTPHPRKMGEGQETQFPDTRARNRDGNDLKPPAESCRCVYSTRPQQSFLAHLPTRWSTEHEKKMFFLSWNWWNRTSYLHERLPQVGSLLDELSVFFEEGAEEQAEVLDEVLLVVLPVGVGQSDVRVQRQHLTRWQKRAFIYLYWLQLFCHDCIHSVFCLRKLLWL